MSVEGIVKLTRHECDLDDDGHDQAEHVVYDPTASGLVATDVQAAIDEVIAASSSGVTVQDEGTPLATAGTTLNFAGAGVTASGTGATKTITIPGSSVSDLDDLSDVTLTTPATGDRLRFDGSVWRNSPLRWEPLFDYLGTAVLAGTLDPVMVEVS